MKILLILLLLFITGCENNSQEEVFEEDNKTIVEKKEEYIDHNPIKVGIYLYDNNYIDKEVIEDVYYTNFISGKDLGSFEVFFSNSGVSGNNFKEAWFNSYNSYTNIEGYKIGFNIKFILDDTTNFNKTFLEPDIYCFGEYFYVYFYDDVNQKEGTFYSHLEQVEENTLITSVKLYAAAGIEKVENIILSVFTYKDEEDFDDNGDYRGNSRYTIRIKKNN